jgi:hypothetical protein
MAHTKLDNDIEVLRYARTALNHSTSRRMLEANLEFLWDYYIGRPSKSLPKHLRREAQGGADGTKHL